MPHPSPPRWIERQADAGRAAALAAAYGMPPAVAELLVGRGLVEAEAVEEYLNPTLARLPSPFLMRGMEEAVGLLLDALREGRPVLVYGDYDADGVSAMALLALFFRQLGIEPLCCHPNRLTDGYGLHVELALRAVAGTDCRLAVTVDCGISDREAVAELRKRGMRVIVTDHHRPPERLPEAEAVLNPLQEGCDFPFKSLAGVGVALYLAMGLRSRLAEQGHWRQGEEAMPNLKELLDLVALGTVGDLVSLTGINRILVKAGLEVLSERARPGVASLCQKAGLAGSRVTADDIAFRLAPRLNAAGRLGAADRALELLLCRDPADAARLAAELDALNRKRRQCGDELYEEARRQAAAQADQGRQSLVLHGEGWHPGVLGIVASRLVEEFGRTVIMLTVDEALGLAKGSGRAIKGVNLHEILGRCDQYLETHGGHAAAAGLSLKAARIEQFARRFEELAAATDICQAGAELMVDRFLSSREMGDPAVVQWLERLEPFGMDNPEPVFATSEGVLLDEVRVVGSSHLRLALSCNGSRWSAIGFGLGHLAPSLAETPVRLAFHFRRNVFRGRESLELNVLDIASDSTP